MGGGGSREEDMDAKVTLLRQTLSLKLKALERGREGKMNPPIRGRMKLI